MTPIPVAWLLLADSDRPPTDEWLCPAETEHAAGLRFAARRADWLLGRWTAKRALLAHWPAGRPVPAAPEIEIGATPEGAPRALLAGRPLPWSLALSHRAGRALCVLAPAGADLGCDLETIVERSPEFIRDYFTPAERRWIEEAPPAEVALRACLAWSAKESALKTLRQGLRLDTRAVEVTIPPTTAPDRWSPLRIDHVAGGRHFAGWWRRRGDLLLTVAADPAPRVPRSLEPGGRG